jgi:hypothetical protein
MRGTYADVLENGGGSVAKKYRRFLWMERRGLWGRNINGDLNIISRLLQG